jgi:hypothetical protein
VLFTLDQAVAAAKLFVDVDTFDIEKFRKSRSHSVRVKKCYS